MPCNITCCVLCINISLSGMDISDYGHGYMVGGAFL